MTEEKKLVKVSQTGALQTMRLWREGDVVHTEWGQLGGKMQTTSDKKDPKNVGKKNEKSGEVVAQERLAYDVAQQLRKGYFEVEEWPDKDWRPPAKVLDLDNPEEGLAFSKPEKKISDKELGKLVREARAVVLRKYNGHCHYLIRGSEGSTRIFTRRMIDVSIKYPEWQAVLDDVIPHNSWVVCELYLDDKRYTHQEAFQLAGGVTKLDMTKGRPTGSADTTKRLKQYNIRLAVFGIPVWDGKENLSVVSTMEHLLCEFPGYAECLVLHEADALIGFAELAAMAEAESDNETLGAAVRARIIELCGDGKEEGAVVLDGDASFAYTFNGTPVRAAGYKVKPRPTADVLAYDWVEGNGDRQGKIGSLKIREWFDGAWVERGTCGSGIPDDRADPEMWNFPVVIKVEYLSRMAKTNHFQVPVFKGIHEEKTPADLEKEESNDEE